MFYWRTKKEKHWYGNNFDSDIRFSFYQQIKKGTSKKEKNQDNALVTIINIKFWVILSYLKKTSKKFYLKNTTSKNLRLLQYLTSTLTSTKL